MSLVALYHYHAVLLAVHPRLPPRKRVMVSRGLGVDKFIM
jgi:hypothetical protein